MPARLIDGAAFAADLRARIADDVASLKEGHGVQPGLAVVLVGEDPASQVYVRNKGKATEAAGMRSVTHRLAADSPEAQVVALVRQLNADPEIHGILVQMPLPPQIDAHKVINEIDPAKDVDGLTELNSGRLALGRPALVPCTPQGSLMLLKAEQPDLAGANAVVIGRSVLVGKPMYQLLLAENCTVTMAHSRTRDLAGLCRTADILVAAVGRPKMVQGNWIKPGALVIDVGINRVDAPELGPDKSRLVGDVDFDASQDVAAAITPVPKGVGPMTIACLLNNTRIAARSQANLEPKDIG